MYSLNNTLNRIEVDRKDKKVILMSGVFDLFHYGHFTALEEASKKGDILIVQIDGNKLVKKRKGINKPIIDQKERARIISSLAFVDYVFISDLPSENYSKLQKIKPDIFIRPILKSESEDHRRIREKKIAKDLPNLHIVWVPQTENISSSIIIDAMNTKIATTQKNKKVMSMGDLLYSKLIRITQLVNTIVPQTLVKSSSAIICYHSVDSDPWKFSINPKDFEKQIKFINDNYNVVSLETLITSKPKNSIAITFDDGYQDTFENALPVLRKFNVPATFFILGEPMRANRAELDNSKDIMNLQTIKKLHRLGFEIGFHTRTHSNLRQLSIPELEEEIIIGKKKLETELGFSLNYFAYPRGLYSNKVIEIVKRAGFRAAFTVDNGSININNKFLIPRYSTDGGLTMKEFSAALSLCGLFCGKFYMKSLKVKDVLIETINYFIKREHTELVHKI